MGDSSSNSAENKDKILDLKLGSEALVFHPGINVVLLRHLSSCYT